MNKFLFLLVMLLLSVGVISAQPHTKRSCPNLVENSVLNGVNGWNLIGGSVYDADMSKDAGSGSAKLFGPHQQLVSKVYSVTPGVQYAFSVYMRTDQSPFNNVTMFASVLGSGGDFIRQTTSTKAANSKVNGWEESTVFIITKPGEVKLQLISSLKPRPLAVRP